MNPCFLAYSLEAALVQLIRHAVPLKDCTSMHSQMTLAKIERKSRIACGQFVDKIYSIRPLRDGSECEGMRKPQ